MGVRRTARQTRGDLEWLQRTMIAMVRCRSVADLLDLAYDAIRDGLGYDRVGLFLVDSSGQGLRQYLGTDASGRKYYPTDRVWSLDAGAYHAHLLSDPRMQPGGEGFVYLSDAVRELPVEVRGGLDGQPHQNVQVSLRTPERVIGLIAVDNLTSGRPITPANAPPLAAFASALATAVENVTLLEERAHRIEDLYGDLHRRVAELERLRALEREEHLVAEAAQRRLAFLAEASALLATSLDYEDTLQRVARLAVPYLADWCTVDIVAEDGTLGQVAVAHVEPEMEQLVGEVRRRNPPDPAGSHALAQVLRSGQPLLVSVVTDEWLRAHTRGDEHFRVMRKIGLRSYMAVPLVARERTLGTITFLSSLPGRHYGLDDLALADDLARRAALAVDNARLYRLAREAQAAAEAAVRMRDEFLGLASHDLRSPLTNILGRADLLEMRLKGSTPPDTAWTGAQIEALRGAARRMLTTVQEITDAVQLQIGRALTLQQAVFDVSEMVRAVVEEYGARQDAAPLTVQAPPGVIVEGDRARLERVVQNIVDNAVKYSPRRTAVRVTVRADDGWAVITVRDRGVGIPAEELPRIFTRFYRASTASGIKGTGIGLAGAKAIVEQHGGRVDLRSTLGRGTTVTVYLPARHSNAGGR